jgi:hypothetical protein
VLERIEQLLGGIADGPAKTIMVAIYALWHRSLAPSDHRPAATTVLADHECLLQRAEMPSFVAGLMSNQLPEWSVDQWLGLATERRAERSRRGHVELPAGVDAALQIIAAEALAKAGRTDEASTLARFAVEELPGNEALIAWEHGPCQPTGNRTGPAGVSPRPAAFRAAWRGASKDSGVRGAARVGGW